MPDEERFVREADHKALERKLGRAEARIEKLVAERQEIEERVAIRTARNLAAKEKQERAVVAAPEVNGQPGDETFLRLPDGVRARLRIVAAGPNAGCLGLEIFPPDGPARLVAIIDPATPDVRRLEVR